MPAAISVFLLFTPAGVSLGKPPQTAPIHRPLANAGRVATAARPCAPPLSFAQSHPSGAGLRPATPGRLIPSRHGASPRRARKTHTLQARGFAPPRWKAPYAFWCGAPPRQSDT